VIKNIKNKKNPILLSFFFIIILIASILFITTFNIYNNSIDTHITDSIQLTSNVGNFERSYIAYSNDNEVYVSWEACTLNDNYGNTDEIYLQKFYNNGSINGDKILLVNRTDLTEEVVALSESTIIIDSNGNLHLFWYVMEYDNPQIGHIYYKKYNSELEEIIGNKIIISYTQLGWGTSSSSSKINKLILDDNNNFHLICCGYKYLYLDDNGDLLDSFIFEENRFYKMVRDNIGNTFILFINQYKINITKLISINGIIDLKFNKNLIDDDEIHISLVDLSLVNYNLYFEINRKCYQVDYNNGNLLSEVNISFNEEGYNFLSQNKTLNYNININQFSSYGNDAIFFYNLTSTFQGQEYIKYRKILTIKKNKDFYYGPACFGLRGLVDNFENLWLTWYVNDGNNGFQVLLWKLGIYGISQTPVIVVAPDIHHYYVNNSYEPPNIPNPPYYC